MALDTEAQTIVDTQIAIENARHANNVAMEVSRARMESIRIAKEVLLENKRNSLGENTEVSAADIIAFANELAAYVSK